MRANFCIDNPASRLYTKPCNCNYLIQTGRRSNYEILQSEIKKCYFDNYRERIARISFLDRIEVIYHRFYDSIQMVCISILFPFTEMNSDCPSSLGFRGVFLRSFLQ